MNQNNRNSARAKAFSYVPMVQKLLNLSLNFLSPFWIGPICHMVWQRCSQHQITTHLPKDNEEVNAHVKRFQATLVAAMVADPVYDREDGDRGHDGDHQESLHGDSASSVTPQAEQGRVLNRDNHNQHDVIHATDAHGRIKSQHRNREREEEEQPDKGTMIIMVLTMTNLTGSFHRKWDISQEASRHIP
jgi:hypothetical protein